MNKVLIELSYNKRVLIDVADLPQLMEILEGKSITNYGYVGDTRVDYLEDEGFHLEFGNTVGKCYTTAEDYRDQNARLEAEKVEEEDAA